MTIHFTKYQATGNDFILIDNRATQHAFSIDQIKKLCDRKFGIGADGLMLIESHPTLSFNLIYFNSDGSQSLCGNGSRAAVHFASSLGLVKNNLSFQAYDGRHEATLLGDDHVKLEMNDVTTISHFGDGLFINTGSPHLIYFVNNLSEFPVFEEGRKIRYSESWRKDGVNVNFVELLPENTIFVRTYERGVENETLSCGTGVTAAALAACQKGYTSPVKIKTPGGNLLVEFEHTSSAAKAGSSPQPVLFQKISLVGPAKMVFKGTLEL